MLRHNRSNELGNLVIELENVAYSYGGGELLSDISIKLAPGSFYFLTGPSGAGKTTLLKLCYGALLQTAGQVRIMGNDVRNLDRDGVAMMRRNVGVVHQDVKFLNHLPVADNVTLPLTVSGRQNEAGGVGLGVIFGMLAVLSLSSAGDDAGFLTELEFQGAEWLAPLLIPVMAGGVALIATRIASRRALEALS